MSEIIRLPCLECGTLKEVEMDSLEGQGIFNVFCSDPKKDCEDRYAFKQ